MLFLTLELYFYTFRHWRMLLVHSLLEISFLWRTFDMFLEAFLFEIYSVILLLSKQKLVLGILKFHLCNCSPQSLTHSCMTRANTVSVSTHCGHDWFVNGRTIYHLFLFYLGVSYSSFLRSLLYYGSKI